MSRIALLAWVLLTGGCWSVPDKAWWSPNDAAIYEPAEVSEMQVVEIAEGGGLFHPEQQGRLRDWLEHSSPHDPLIVFVHGWHHNAWYESERRMDGNLRGFRAFLHKLELQSGGKQLDAIYVGWRGDSMDTLIPWEASDFITVRGRKEASVKIGNGALKELLDYLRKRHPERRILVAGHSFGGSAVLHAVNSWLEEGQEMPENFEYLLMNPAAHYDELKQVETALNARIQVQDANSVTSRDLLARPHRKLLVMQAKGDFPVRFLYPIAIGERAIGFDRNHISHHGRICTGDLCESNSCDVHLAANFVMQPVDGCQNPKPRAIWVVLAEDGLSNNHNDIFTGTQARILAGWIGERLGLVAPTVRR